MFHEVEVGITSHKIKPLRNPDINIKVVKKPNDIYPNVSITNVKIDVDNIVNDIFFIRFKIKYIYAYIKVLS